MTVKRIVSRKKAVQILGNSNLYDADEWIFDDEGSGTPLNLHRRLAPALSRQLRFVSPKSDSKGLVFTAASKLDGQTIRGVRELTRESAEFLDQIIEITDRMPRSNQLLIVTKELLGGERVQNVTLPEEVPSDSKYCKGSVQRIVVNRYERDPRAREECIRHFGSVCDICKLDFAAKYGALMEGLIHVHHLKPLSKIEAGYQVDPIRDLLPVCPNCHAVLHRREPPYTPDEVRRFLRTKPR